mmetsp:Transcript_21091/g.65101  ORF Transcript_21091/g.65101 Transcript_21091/m.65101 type:complete len:292 (-) Transcript_21091:942-1817(-)
MMATKSGASSFAVTEHACFKAAAAVQLALTAGFALSAFAASSSSSSSPVFVLAGSSPFRRSSSASNRTATAWGAMGARAPRQSATMALVGSASASAERTSRSATRSTKGAKADGSAAAATSFVAAKSKYSESSSFAFSSASSSAGRKAATDPDATSPKESAADVLWSFSFSEEAVPTVAVISASKAAGLDFRSTILPSSPSASVASRTRPHDPLEDCATSSATFSARCLASAFAQSAANADAAFASICLSARDDNCSPFFFLSAAPPASTSMSSSVLVVSAVLSASSKTAA